MALGLSACGGSDNSSSTSSGSSSSTSGGSTTSTTTTTTTSTTTGPATHGPTEESPGVFTGTTTCNHPHTLEFDGTATEVITIEAALSIPASSTATANPVGALLFGTEAVLEGENPVVITGPVTGSTPVNGRHTLSVQQSGRHAFKIEVAECQAVSYRVTIARDIPAATNATRETATAITAEAPATGSLGCGQHRWFSYEARGRVRLNVTLSGEARAAGATGEAKLTLENDTGAVTLRGNPITAPIASPAGAPASQVLAITRAGRYFLHLEPGASCTLSSFSIAVTP